MFQLSLIALLLYWFSTIIFSQDSLSVHIGTKREIKLISEIYIGINCRIYFLGIVITDDKHNGFVTTFGYHVTEDGR